MVTILFSQVTHLSMSNNPLIGLDPFVLASAVPNLTRFNIIGVIVVDAVIIQSWKMSNLLHGPISTNQILPQEKRVNRDIFGTSNLQNRTYGVSCDE